MMSPTQELIRKDFPLEHWPIERLLPSARNARTHSEAQVAEIAGSMKAFGFANPILAAPAGEVIAGHGRLAAARKLGLANVPVIVLEGLSELQRRQLMLADNRIALNAGWDAEMLAFELQDLASLGADLEALGFTAKELARALTPAKSGLTGEDDVPALQEQAISRPGDVWCLGPHRIACGDSTDAEAISALFGGVAPELMVTDPPYGVEYDPGWRHRRGLNKSERREEIRNDDRADWQKAWDLFPGRIAYVWHAALHSTTVAQSLTRSGFSLRAQIIWAKDRMVLGRGDYHWHHEPCWYAVRGKGNWVGDRKQTTLWTIASGNQDSETEHATQKPVECMRRPILNNSSPGQAVYDPFLGSGTTLIAAESCGRHCYAIDLEPRYVDLALRRWEAFSGEKAQLRQSGQSFEETASERASDTASQSHAPCL